LAHRVLGPVSPDPTKKRPRIAGASRFHTACQDRASSFRLLLLLRWRDLLYIIFERLAGFFDEVGIERASLGCLSGLRHSHASQCDPRGARKLASTSTGFLQAGICIEDAIDHYSIGKDIEIIIAPLTGGPRGRRSFQDKHGQLLSSPSFFAPILLGFALHCRCIRIISTRYLRGRVCRRAEIRSRRRLPCAH
jgi:hypothetical protein